MTEEFTKQRRDRVKEEDSERSSKQEGKRGLLLKFCMIEKEHGSKAVERDPSWS